MSVLAKRALPALVMVMPLLTHSAAAQPVPPGQEGELGKLLAPVHGRKICFARAYDGAHLKKHPKQKVTALLFRLEYYRHPPDPPHYPQGQRNYYFRMSAKVKGQHKTLYASGECVAGDNSIGCGVECDGGGVSVERDPKGEAIIIRIDDRIRMTQGCDGDDENNTVDLTPGVDDKAFRLDNAALSTCRALDRKR
jgi:hypothetical protein